MAMQTTGLFVPAFTLGIHHVGKVLLNKHYRDFQRLSGSLRNCKRFRPGTIKINKRVISYVDAASLISAYKDIFFYQSYKFHTDNKRPYILDCGANIGLATLFFKQLYPEAEIVAFEPDVAIYKCLIENLSSNKISKVTALNKAVWHCESEMSFLPDHADGGRLTHENSGNQITVPTVDLKKYCDRPVDFLKIDIEGAEWDVLSACTDILKNCRYLFVEYHSTQGKEQKLPELLRLLKDAGFRFDLKSRNASTAPFMQSESYCGFDMHVDIYCKRDPV